ncbi:MAG: hypothetical protein A2Z16_09945 [Chloroflexi bacterium RBG_16_54_18]|nr:MAG: hypothetical protein A2Z16_09945 [Chloroflexi bacterium RBG_16_54_18]
MGTDKYNIFWKTFLSTLFLFLLAGAGFASGYLFHAHQFPGQSFPVLNEAYQLLIDNGLVEPPADPALEYGMIRGMLQEYGEPHTIFLDPPQHELSTDDLEGKYGGIGVQINKESQGNWVLFPFAGSPAQKAGIQEGDRLLAVDDLLITPNTPSEQIQAQLRGAVRQVVRVSIGRAPDFSTQEFNIRREEISLPSVTWHLALDQPQVGVIKVNLIAASTAGEIERAAADLQERGAQAFILDLRDNPGGLLDVGIEIARLFLKEGVIIEQQYRDREAQTYDVEQPGKFSDLPLAVLINGGSASAAEIAAGAIQQHERAPLLGQPSYGKDTVQLVFELRDKSSLHVTAARWRIPGLNPPIKDHGLQPDILVDPPQDASGYDLVLKAAIQVLLESL